MGDLDLGLRQEGFHGQLAARALAPAAVAQRFAFRQLGQLAQVVRRKVGRAQQHVAHAPDLGNGGEVLQRIWRAGEQAGVDGDGPRVGHQQGVAVSRCARDGFAGQQAVGAGLVLDEEGLLEVLAQRIAQQAAKHVGAAAGGRGHHDANGLGGPVGVGEAQAMLCGKRGKAQGRKRAATGDGHACLQ